MLRILLCLTLLTAPVAISGCGGSNEPAVWVTGKLLKGGSKYDPPAEQQITITFVAIEVENAQGKVGPSTEPYMALYDRSTGTFKVPGKEGSGIPPGKYRVAITSKMNREALNAIKPKQKVMDREKDYLEDKFGVATSPIVRQIKVSSDLTIDMDKPTESANAS
jgi:hypothetical protein